MTAVRSVWLPDPAGVELLGEVPGGTEIVVWPGRGEPPRPAGPVFWVPPFPRVDYAAVAEAVPELGVVQLMTAGFENAVAELPHRVALANARGVHNTSVAEWVMAAVLASMRRIPEVLAAQREGRTLQAHGGVLRGATVMVLGYGSIGASVEHLMLAFGAHLVRVARTARGDVHAVEELPRLLPDVDVMVVLTPASPATRHLIGRDVLAALPDGALVVNASRGSLVDQDALLAELRSGRLRAALDVGEPDPLPADHPLIAAGALYTPHISGMTSDKLPAVFGFVGAQLRRWAAGEHLENLVPRGTAPTDRTAS